MELGTKIFQVDSFADRPFAGNPAVVCLFPGSTDAAWMQNLAQEMNLAATAFVERDAEGFVLRWFSPQLELTLCGHGTLAAAHILWEEATLLPMSPFGLKPWPASSSPVVTASESTWTSQPSPPMRRHRPPT